MDWEAIWRPQLAGHTSPLWTNAHVLHWVFKSIPLCSLLIICMNSLCCWHGSFIEKILVMFSSASQWYLFVASLIQILSFPGVIVIIVSTVLYVLFAIFCNGIKVLFVIFIFYWPHVSVPAPLFPLVLSTALPLDSVSFALTSLVVLLVWFCLLPLIEWKLCEGRDFDLFHSWLYY